MDFLNSERSDECIDFIMMCILDSELNDECNYSKMNLVSALGRSFFEIPNSFQKRREKPKKKLRKSGIFT
ncbi:Uncharacterized protein FWK35_00004136 [Aphis craccivora]|uniref:Uncharacterized protein n=1 Tax=Aphis craccivora TaxID=307492 RepID=A0A6G0ZMF4_APHCR|nr:Uncharacterized protein FWK35_00004136 [Aphis craccivora]